MVCPASRRKRWLVPLVMGLVVASGCGRTGLAPVPDPPSTCADGSDHPEQRAESIAAFSMALEHDESSAIDSRVVLRCPVAASDVRALLSRLDGAVITHMGLRFPSVDHGLHLPVTATTGDAPIDTLEAVDAYALGRARELPPMLATAAAAIEPAVAAHDYEVTGLHLRGSPAQLQAFWNAHDGSIDYVLPAPSVGEWPWYRAGSSP